MSVYIMMYFMSQKVCVFLILANSADPDEMLPNAAFHLGLQCLQKYLFTSIQNEKCICYFLQQFFSHIKGHIICKRKQS